MKRSLRIFGRVRPHPASLRSATFPRGEGMGTAAGHVFEIERSPDGEKNFVCPGILWRWTKEGTTSSGFAALGHLPQRGRLWEISGKRQGAGRRSASSRPAPFCPRRNQFLPPRATVLLGLERPSRLGNRCSSAAMAISHVLTVDFPGGERAHGDHVAGAQGGVGEGQDPHRGRPGPRPWP